MVHSRKFSHFGIDAERANVVRPEQSLLQGRDQNYRNFEWADKSAPFQKNYQATNLQKDQFSRKCSQPCATSPRARPSFMMSTIPRPGSIRPIRVTRTPAMLAGILLADVNSSS
jgi:hypothetical protein